MDGGEAGIDDDMLMQISPKEKCGFVVIERRILNSAFPEIGFFYNDFSKALHKNHILASTAPQTWRTMYIIISMFRLTTFPSFIVLKTNTIERDPSH